MIDIWQTLRDMMALNEIHNFFDKIGGSFWGDLLSNSLGAVISGVIILIISTRMSRKISKEESEQNMIEMKERIRIEVAENLKMEKQFYILKLEQSDLMEIEKLMINLDREFYKIRLYSIFIIKKSSNTESTVKLERLKSQFEDLSFMTESVDKLMSLANKAISLLFQHFSLFDMDDIHRIKKLNEDIEKVCTSLSVLILSKEIDANDGVDFLKKELEDLSVENINKEIERITNELSEINELIRSVRIEKYYHVKFDK